MSTLREDLALELLEIAKLDAEADRYWRQGHFGLYRQAKRDRSEAITNAERMQYELDKQERGE